MGGSASVLSEASRILEEQRGYANSMTPVMIVRSPES